VKVEKMFTQGDRDAIAAAVRAAEERTGGEIVPVVVEASDEYEVATWRAATLGALTAALVAAVVYGGAGLWSTFIVAWIALPATLGATASALLVNLWPAARRAVIGDEILQRRTMRRAYQAFLQEEVFQTRDRTGILIFLSLFEHRVVVLGDSGINARVAQEEWQGIVDGVVAGIRQGTPGPALVEAIQRCGQLLERRGVALRPDDTNELSNEVRLHER
jgi:putative membrane protein